MYSNPIKSIALALCAIFVAIGVYYVVSDSNRDTVVADQESAEMQDSGGLATVTNESGESGSLDWCHEHAVPESQCTQCNPDLIARFQESGDWCGGHGIPESHCRLCNPEIEFPQEIYLRSLSESSESQRLAAVDWCREHSVPESVCTQCNSELIPRFQDARDWCVEHGIPESHCRLCNPGIEFPQEITLRSMRRSAGAATIEVTLLNRPNQEVCATNDAIITLAGSATAERVGLNTASVSAADYRPSTSAPAEVVYDEGYSAVVSISSPALVTRWLVSAGAYVEEDEILAYLQSPQLGELQADLLAAVAELRLAESEQRRHDELKARSLISESDYERQSAMTARAKAEVERLRGLLLSGGLNRGDIDECVKHGGISDRFPLRSPSAGLIIERNAKLGELLPAGGAFLTLADPSHMWIEAQLTEQQLRGVSLDDELVFSADGGGLDRVGARVIWISHALDPHTRTGTVRGQVNDPAVTLQSGMFGRAQIFAQTGGPITLAPRDAVQWEGCCNVVFVQESDYRFRPRKVTIAAAERDYYQISSGLEPGERIVTDGAFLLKTELKKSSIGAGCCGIEPAG